MRLQAGNLRLSEATTGDILQKKVFLENSKISQENTCVGVCFYKVEILRACCIFKKDFNADSLL